MKKSQTYIVMINKQNLQNENNIRFERDPRFHYVDWDQWNIEI